MNPEQPSIETPESKEPNSDIVIEYQYTDLYNRTFGSGKVNAEDLPPCPKEASQFDGYIETPFEQFAFQGRVAEFQKMLDEVKKFCQKKSELLKVAEKLKEANRDHDISVGEYQSTNKTERWIKTHSRVEELEKEKWSLEAEIKALSEKVAAHKM